MTRNSLQLKAIAGGSLHGSIAIPGDKSISHRAVILGSLAEGVSEISGFLQGEDSIATLNAFRAMGVRIEGPHEGKVIIHGVGLSGLHVPPGPLDLGNSGTSMRLLAGLLSAQAFDVTLTGDASLSKRPMKRVTDPLSVMGAHIEASERGTPPLYIKGGGTLTAIDYHVPVASAQVKSALLLAGLYARGKTCITEPSPTRDHTERMLEGFGYRIDRRYQRICIEGGGRLIAGPVDIPADISSAAFFMVGASIAAGSDITLMNVGVNPTRTGVITILRQMGARIEILNQRESGGEPVADIEVHAGRLHGIHIPEEQVPLAIDEFPVLFVAAACAQGETVLTGASELRVKESDRIQMMADGLANLGISAQPTTDGMIIQGGRLRGGCVNSGGDHRIAMAFAIAALCADDPVVIDDCVNISTSFPGFVETAASAGLRIDVQTVS